MVARSEDGQAFVTQVQFQQLTDVLNTTVQQLQARFIEQDRKFFALDQAVGTTQSVTGAKITDLEDTMQTVGISVHQMSAKMEDMHTKIQMVELEQSELSVVGKRLESAVQSTNMEHIQLAMQRLDGSEGAFATLRDHVVELQRLMVLAETAARSHHSRLDVIESSGSRSDKSRLDILDPKNLIVEKLEGQKKRFDTWRKAMEVYLSRFYPQIEMILPYLKRAPTPVTEANFIAAARQATVDPDTLK